MFSGLTYQLRTFGCQMNKHDSERVAGMLEAKGARAVHEAADADIVIYMTCCVREAADTRIFGQLASIKNLPFSSGSGRDGSASFGGDSFGGASFGGGSFGGNSSGGASSTSASSGLTSTTSASSGLASFSGASSLSVFSKPRRRIIAVGGCIGQRDGERLIEEFPHVDVVFGTHNIANVTELLAAALDTAQAQVEVFDDERAHMDKGCTPANDLPARREHVWHAWLPIMTGCNNFCSYCIVPYVRGRELSREKDDILREAERLLNDGVREITLLGQNVNSYGRDLYGQPQFAEILRAVANLGVERIRFATSHPKDLSDATIAAFAELPAVMPALHLPVQSGSDAILKAMNRHYSAEHYLGLISKVRAVCAASGKGEVAFSTDIIVGFPGESSSDFEATMELTCAARFAQVFTFIYSRREKTPAALIPDDTPREVIQERFDRLVELVQQSAWECNQAELGTVVDVLFEGASKRDATILAGKSPKNQTVHTPLPAGKSVADFAGRIFPVRIQEARTWYLRGELL